MHKGIHEDVSRTSAVGGRTPRFQGRWGFGRLAGRGSSFRFSIIYTTLTVYRFLSSSLDIYSKYLNSYRAMTA